jgi:hypothetical protein
VAGAHKSTVPLQLTLTVASDFSVWVALGRLVSDKALRV